MWVKNKIMKQSEFKKRERLIKKWKKLIHDLAVIEAEINELTKSKQEEIKW